MTINEMTPENTVDVVDNQFMLALCLWREARGELATVGPIGYIAVGCVLRNRGQRDTTTIYEEVIKRLQFSSITAPGDPELTAWPAKRNGADYAAWITAHQVARGILSGAYSDPTRGATLYYADSIPFPEDWNRAKVHQTVKLGKHIFLTEV